MARLPTIQEMQVDALVQRKFPTMRYDRSVAYNTVGGPVADEHEARRRFEECQRYRITLASLPEDEIRKQYAELQSEIEAGRLFNLPIADADFSYWAKASYWTLDEAIALSFGKNPVFANWKIIEPLLRQSAFAQSYARHRDLVLRAKTMGQLWEQCSPSTFLAWAERMKFVLPADLVVAVKELGIQISDWKTLFEEMKVIADTARAETEKERQKYLDEVQAHSKTIDRQREHMAKMDQGYKSIQEKNDLLLSMKDDRIAQLENQIAEFDPPVSPPKQPSLGVRERESLLKLILGIAIKGYVYDPKAARSPTAKEIASDMALVGLSMDEDTVRKYLNEAKQLLPRD